ncbi:endonuclease/exonuclease/phosphatase family protein [uncultured Cyclobacterium sp.]|uniref:endonuclease/exonuclease/phosphatase family protein n=1 Tax=uncultured Cyclobacterium sp. TaxID=453820 RepID=UPI0030EF5465|tara:strand:- start:99675 stop:100754 length:1080 start_codon:yes stop_codon:yes gene_type:complete
MDLVLNILKISLSIISILAVIASKLKVSNWWVRVFDFPRIQLLLMATLAIVLFLMPYSEFNNFNLGLLTLVVFSWFYQARKIFPYTVVAGKEVYHDKTSNPDNEIAILVSNVLTPNRHVEKLISLVKKHQPNLVLTLESDKWWEEQMSVLEEDYKCQVKIPLDNLYGMHLYSNLELKDTKVHYLVEDDIPSIHTSVILPSGKPIQIHCIHPEPPSPTESDTSLPRDAELLIVGKNVKDAELPTLVFGDLNDVAWSRTTRLFQKISGLLDPRKGRGFFNTYNAKHLPFRWPLDHIFHSEDFVLREIKRLPSISSDHFPMFIRLKLKADNGQEDKEEALDKDEKNWTEETIGKANPNILTI